MGERQQCTAEASIPFVMVGVTHLLVKSIKFRFLPHPFTPAHSLLAMHIFRLNALTFLLVIGLFLPSLSQPQKKDLILSPQIVASEWRFDSNSALSAQEYVIGTSLHYFFSSHFSFGFYLKADYLNSQPKVVNVFAREAFFIAITPEIQYRILKTKVSPFIRLQPVELGYSYQFIDNPIISQRMRSQGNYTINYNPVPRTSVGVDYFIKPQTGLFIIMNAQDMYEERNYKPNLSFGLGCHFTLN